MSQQSRGGNNPNGRPNNRNKAPARGPRRKKVRRNSFGNNNNKSNKQSSQGQRAQSVAADGDNLWQCTACLEVNKACSSICRLCGSGGAAVLHKRNQQKQKQNQKQSRQNSQKRKRPGNSGASNKNNAASGEPQTGQICRWVEKKGFGFVSSDGTDDEYFFHVSSIQGTYKKKNCGYLHVC